MKTIAFYLSILFVLAGCTVAQDDPQPTKETHYNFNVTAADNKRFKATITWQSEGIQYVDPVDTWGYGSSFEITPGEQFTITVTSDATNLKLWIFPNENEHLPSKEIYPLQSNRTYTLDHNLNLN